MEYGKLVDGNLVSPGNTVLIDNVWVANPSDSQLLEAGYKIVTRGEIPAYDSMFKHIDNVYTEDEFGIIVSYNIVDNLSIGLTKLEFRSRLTMNEKIALDNYEMTIDAMAIDAQTKVTRKAIMKTVTKDFDCATYIDLGDPATIQGVQLFATFGILTSVRANEILGIV